MRIYLLLLAVVASTQATTGNLTTLGLEICKIYEHFAIIRWTNFEIPDHSEILSWVVNYREASERNVTKFNARDAGGTDLWESFTVDPDVDPKATFIAAVLFALKPFTQYAVYVHTHTIPSAIWGATTNISYFKTLPDDPARRYNNVKRKRRGRRNSSLHRVEHDCCIAGMETSQTFLNDGKAIRQEQCANNAEQHVESMEKLAGMCKMIYSRCCVKTGRQPCTDDNEEGCVRRNRGGRRRRKHKNRRRNVEVNGDVEDIDELVKEVEIAIEEADDQM